jgi:hypothetical protein
VDWLRANADQIMVYDHTTAAPGSATWRSSAQPRAGDSRSLLIICVIGRKRTARVIGDHHGRDVGTATVLLAATDPCRSG